MGGADLVWESAQPGKDKKEKKGEVGKLKAEIAELEEQVERLEKMKGNMLKWARGGEIGSQEEFDRAFTIDAIFVYIARRGFIRFIFVFLYPNLLFLRLQANHQWR